MAQAVIAGRRLTNWALLLSISVAASAAVARDRPLLWALHGAGNTVYIAGSMHMLKPEDSTLSDGLDQAYAQARRIVMEVDTDEIDQSSTASWMLEHGRYPPESHKTLHSTLGEARWQRTNAVTQKVGLPLEVLDGVEPWVVAVTYSVMQLQSQGLDPKLGVEEQLSARAHQDHKPISGFETVQQQLALFSELSEADQLRFLDLTLDEADDPQAQLTAMTAAWRRGDEAELAKELLQEYSKFPQLYAILVERRNSAWIPQIKALLTGHDDVLVVVGALHLVGERGVIRLLQQAGLKPERIRH